MKLLCTLCLALTLFTSACTFHMVQPESAIATPEGGVDEQPEIAATPDCDMVKGNISADGRKLYHLPGMPNYNQVKIDEAKGEMFFCTEQEALDAGWSKAGG